MRDDRAETVARSHEICILLLEDSALDAELLAAHLTKADLRFDITRVVNRRQFVAALNEGRCEIILADYSLPDFDGLSALNIAQALQPDLPFLFVSGVVGEEFATNALKRGATDYVMKRNLSRLATAVERALEQAHARKERRRTEEALRQSEVNARLSIDAARLGLWEYQPQSGDLLWDARCNALFGKQPEALVAFVDFLDAVHPEDRARVADLLGRATTSGSAESQIYHDEFRIVVGGLERWISTRGQAQFENDVCTSLVGVMRDITDEYQAREGLRKLAEQLEEQVAERTAERDRIWRLSPDLFAAAGFDGRLRRVNPAWGALLGHDPDMLVGVSLSLLIHPDDRRASEDVIRRIGAGEVVERFENRLLHIDGSWRWVSWTAAPEGEAFYAVGRDITAERKAIVALAERNAELAAEIEERERVEEALRQMQRLEAVGQLTSGVAHDFNNLLTVILGNIGFLEKQLGKDVLQGKVGERIGHMRSAAERGAKLTAQMLAFSRRQKLEPKPIDMNDAVAGMRDLLQSTIAGSIRIETVLKNGLWPALVDPTQFELIVLNLAINARDAMEVGGALTIETSNVVLTSEPQRPEDPSPGHYVVLSVSDTGAGMTPDVLAKAFEPFFTTKDIGKGSGLGLAQVYGFAKQSGGGVKIESRRGEGTRVQVFLPKADGAPLAEEGAEWRPLGASGACTVLLVDDDTAVREVAGAMLEDLGCTVIGAGSGGAALDILTSGERIDLILSDYAMPGMNGVEVERAAADLRPGVPLIFMTGYADLTALRHVGEERIIRKPFRDGELARKLGLALPARLSGNVIPLASSGKRA